MIFSIAHAQPVRPSLKASRTCLKNNQATNHCSLPFSYVATSKLYLEFLLCQSLNPTSSLHLAKAHMRSQRCTFPYYLVGFAASHRMFQIVRTK